MSDDAAAEGPLRNFQAKIQEAGYVPIEVDGAPVFLRWKLRIVSGRHLHVCIEELGSSELEQGVALKFDCDARVDGVDIPEGRFAVSTERDLREYEAVAANDGATVTAWNVYRDSSGNVGYSDGGAALTYEVDGDRVRFFCSDRVLSGRFDDLVFSLEPVEVVGF